MELPTSHHKLSAMCLVLCLLQCVFTTPVYQQVRQDLLEQLRQRERRYASNTHYTLYPEELEDPFGFKTDRLKRTGSPIALNPGLVVLDILRSTIDNDRRRQQMSEAAAMNSELFTRVGKR
uniref:Corticotropin-releasing hormone 1 n=1 Tax=Ophionotus victoriae TaxID=667017 RepID=A0A220W0D4_9ECHI|nr:corticotropin-releasing hormone 1 precursor [Ophionotus victoriae]